MKKRLAKKFGIYSAVGVAGGMTFGSTAAEADIIFTPFTGSATQGSPLEIDMDGDTVADFVFDLRVVGPNGYGSNSNWAAINPGMDGVGNAVAATAPSPFSGGPSYGPNNLAFGATISGQSFFTFAAPESNGGPLQMAYTSYGSALAYGPFGGANFPANENSGYVGVQFATGGGETVFGWIGVTVEGDVTNANFADASIVVNNFAYATDGTTITAGQTEVIPEPSSLGLLALGATGLAARRRRVTD